MPHCSKCGTMVAENVAFCPNCGQAQPGASPAGGTPAGQQAQAGQSGLQENVAGLLCYVLGWLTGLIFFLIDKRPFVRFHAAQSIVLFGALHVVSILIGWMFGISAWTGSWGVFGIGWMISSLVSLLTLVLWIVCMVKAYQGERFRIPLAADVADSLAK